MPWRIADVEKRNSGLTAKQKRQWVAVANSERERLMKKKDKQADAKAIKAANAVVKTNTGIKFNAEVDSDPIYVAMHTNKDNQKSIKHLMSSLVREDVLDGVKHYVVPSVLIVEGVHNGVLYTNEELKKYPEAWNGRPVVKWHPSKNGKACSASDPKILEESTFGTVYNTRYMEDLIGGPGLAADIWINIPKANKVAPEVMKMLKKNQNVEISTGLFTDDLPPKVVTNEAGEQIKANWNGEDYDCIATNYRPDHLAVLPGGKGACSWNDGAGMPRINELNDNGEGNLNHDELGRFSSGDGGGSSGGGKGPVRRYTGVLSSDGKSPELDLSSEVDKLVSSKEGRASFAYTHNAGTRGPDVMVERMHPDYDGKGTTNIKLRRVGYADSWETHTTLSHTASKSSVLKAIGKAESTLAKNKKSYSQGLSEHIKSKDPSGKGSGHHIAYNSKWEQIKANWLLKKNGGPGSGPRPGNSDATPESMSRSASKYSAIAKAATEKATTSGKLSDHANAANANSHAAHISDWAANLHYKAGDTKTGDVHSHAAQVYRDQAAEHMNRMRFRNNESKNNAVLGMGGNSGKGKMSKKQEEEECPDCGETIDECICDDVKDNEEHIAELKANELSHGEVSAKLGAALREALTPAPVIPGQPQQSPNAYVCDVFDSHFIYNVYGNGRDSYYQKDYTIDKKGNVTLGDDEPIVVVRKQSWEPKTNASCDDGDGADNEDNEDEEENTKVDSVKKGRQVKTDIKKNGGPGSGPRPGGGPSENVYSTKGKSFADVRKSLQAEGFKHKSFSDRGTGLYAVTTHTFEHADGRTAHVPILRGKTSSITIKNNIASPQGAGGGVGKSKVQTNSKGVNNMDRSAKVDALIKANSAVWGEDDRELLEGMSDAQFAGIEKGLKANEVKAPATQDEFIAALPAGELKESIQSGLKMHSDMKADLVIKIKALKTNTFSEDSLKAKSLDELKALAALAGVDQPVPSYAGRSTGVEIKANAEEGAGEMPAMTFGKK